MKGIPMQINIQIPPQLKQQWNENPIGCIAAGALAATSVAKVVDAMSAAQGRRAYAKQVKISEKRQKNQQ